MSLTLLFNTNTAEFGDALVVVLFTLFVASTISERIIDFVKLRIPGLWLKSANPKDEIKRHQKLWLLAFFIGLITTGVLNLNLIFMLVDAQSVNNIYGFRDWILKNREGWFVMGTGYLFTALFISIGSKFWHDLLDIVLFVKNNKRKISEFSPERVQKIEHIESYLQEDEYQIAQKALDAHRSELERKYNTDSIYIGYEYINGLYRWTIVVIVRRDAEKARLFPVSRHKGSPAILEYITSYGYVIKFPVLIEYSEFAVATDDRLSPPAKAGGGIFNSAQPDIIGTFGCVVRDVMEGCDDLLLLTCCHCVRIPGEHSWNGIDQNSKKREIRYKANANDNKMPIIGEIKRAYRDGRMDVAIIKSKSNKLISDYITSSGKTIPVGSRDVTMEDIARPTRVWFSGATSGNCEGFIVHINCTVPIRYASESEPYKIRKLIAFSQSSTAPYKKPCGKGDSGTILLDAETYQALGMIVASDDKFGYAIPISDILKTNDLQLFANPCNPNVSI